MSAQPNPFRLSSSRWAREADRLFSSALEADKAIVRLIGPRRVGKTDLVSTYAREHRQTILSIALKPLAPDLTSTGLIVAALLEDEIRQLAHTNPKLHRTLLDMEQAETKPSTKRSLAGQIGAQLLGLNAKLSSEHVTEKAAPPARATDADLSVTSQLRRLELAAVKLKIRPLVFFDEIQELVLIPAGLPTVWAIRNEIQHHTACRYVFAGSNQRLFAALDSGPRAPLLHLGSAIAVPRLTTQEADAWALPLFQAGGRNVQTLAPATELMAGKIGELADVCAALWEMTKPGQTVFEADLRNALLRTIQSQPAAAPFVRSLTPAQAQVLRYIGLNPEDSPLTRSNTESIGLNAGTIHRALQALVTHGLVEAFGRNEYTLATPLATLAALEPLSLSPRLRRATAHVQAPRFRL